MKSAWRNAIAAYVKRELKLQSRDCIHFLIPLRKLRTSLYLLLWIKYYFYSYTSIALSLNTPG